MIPMKGMSSLAVTRGAGVDFGTSYETISDLMNLQDQIDAFQRIIFSHFNQTSSNECRISSLVPLVKESWNIYRFITSMLRAMHRSKYIHT